MCERCCLLQLTAGWALRARTLLVPAPTDYSSMPLQLLYAGAGEAIAVYARAANGDLALTATVPVSAAVSCLFLSPDRHRLFVATADAVLTFRIDQASGELSFAPSAPGPLPYPPCYMTTDRSGRYLLLTC